MKNYKNTFSLCNILASVALLASTGFVPIAAVAADAAVNEPAQTWDYATAYDKVEDSAVRIESMGRVGSGVLRKSDGGPNCEVITVHRVTQGASQIGVTIRSGDDYVGSLVRADEQKQLDVYMLKDMPASSSKCPSIAISTNELKLDSLVLGFNTILDVKYPGPLFGVIARLMTAPQNLGGDSSRIVAMAWMVTLSGDHGAGVYNSKGELVGLVESEYREASFLEVGKTVRSALDEAHK